jgi:ribonuclease HI
MKLAWNIISNPSAMWVKIIKAKYKCGQDPTPQVKASHSCSSTWRAIVSVWDTTIQGIQWNIGNVRKISFWNDSWLPSGTVLNAVVSQPIDQNLAAKTVNYFSDNNGTWNLQEIRNLLPDHMIDQINGVSAAAESLGEDNPSWPYSSNGTFTVQSAYDLILNLNNSDSNLWNNVWKWEGPQKIKCFFWLVLKDGLKTNDKRNRCRISLNSNCALCSTERESPLHLLRDCSMVTPIWNRFGFDFHMDNSGDIRNWFGRFLNPSQNDRHVLFGIINWCIWTHRNQLVFEDKMFDWQAVVLHVGNLLLDISHTVTTPPHMDKSYHNIQVGWTRPGNGWVKCNTDGAVIAQNHQAGCGGVFRDELGSWMGGFTRMVGNCSVIMAELWGILSALQFVQEKGYQKIVIETDSVTVVDLMVKGCPPNHPCASIVSRINRLRMQEREIIFQHTYRQANQVANWFAGYSLSLPTGIHSFTSPPPGCTNLLWQDCVGVYFNRRVRL